MSGGKDQDPIMAMLLYGLMIVGLFFLLWWALSPFFLEILKWIRWVELWIAGLLFQDQAALATAKVLPSYSGFAPKGDPYQFTEARFFKTTELSAPYFRWPLVVMATGMGIYIWFFSPKNKFKTRYDLEGFIKIQSLVWPVIKPFVDFNPIKSSARIPGMAVPEELPLFAEALSPEEWIAFHRIPLVNNLPDKEVVRRAFLLQLGPRWQGSKSLPMHLKAVYAALALKGVQRRNESDDLFGEISACWNHKTGLVLPAELISKIEKLINDPAVGGEADKIAAKHAWRTTGMLGVLRWARLQGGVVAPAAFVWMRGEDRTTWYPLNNLGRRSFHAEAAGAMAHYMAEEAAQKPLVIPRLETALVTLNVYISGDPNNPQVKPVIIPTLQSKSPKIKKA
jgi:intracellular multiplication protein IcmP